MKEFEVRALAAHQGQIITSDMTALMSSTYDNILKYHWVGKIAPEHSLPVFNFGIRTLTLGILSLQELQHKGSLTHRNFDIIKLVTDPSVSLSEQH